MSEPFSQAYIDLCTQPEVADRLREEWEPRWGDLVRTIGGRKGLITSFELTISGTDYRLVGVTFWDNGQRLNCEKDGLIPLFQPRQIIEMLEERGYKDWELFAWAGEGWEETDMLDEGYYCTIYTLDEDGDPTQRNFFGPKPATALLRAWLEVVKDE